MAVPDFQSLMLPVLRFLGAGNDHSTGEIRQAIAKEFALTTDDLAQMLPSGRQTTFSNRVAWAQGYLKQAGLVESPQRAIYRITEKGRTALAANPPRIDIEYLNRFPEFVTFRATAEGSTGGDKAPKKPGAGFEDLTPDEQIRYGYRRLRASLGAQLLERMKQMGPKAFEVLVVDLLVHMGYGGSHEDAAEVVGAAGDEGIDGIIKEDRLGLDAIYIQAKRWKETVGRPEIQRFAGALRGQKASKGVFLTTAAFSNEAREYVRNLPSAIVLIDGPQLAQLMLDYGVGVTESEVVKIVKLDEDYFEET